MPVTSYPKITGSGVKSLPTVEDLTALSALTPEYDGYAVVVLDIDRIYTYNLSTLAWVTSSGGPSFSVIQTDLGTFPTAASSSDVATFTSSDGSILITGNAVTDTINFVLSDSQSIIAALIFG